MGDANYLVVSHPYVFYSLTQYIARSGARTTHDIHIEMGMSPMEAIVSATSDSARSCWTHDQVGSLEVGKQADLLVVEGDPSQDISALENVVDVFQGGDLVDCRNYV